MKGLIAVVVYLVLIAESVNSNDSGCNIDLYAEKVGCYNSYVGSSQRILNEQLVNARNPYSFAYGGFLMDWFRWKATLNKLLCRCVDKARKQGYQYIGLHFFGECWSGAGSENYQQGGQSDSCFQEIFRPCQLSNKDHACMGGVTTNYIFKVKPEASQRNPKNPNEQGAKNGHANPGDGNGNGNANGNGNGNANGNGEGKGNANDNSKGNANGNGKGNANGNGKDKGNANGDGKDKGKANGNGKDKGNANGNGKDKGNANGNGKDKGKGSASANVVGNGHAHGHANGNGKGKANVNGKGKANGHGKGNAVAGNTSDSGRKRVNGKKNGHKREANDGEFGSIIH